MVLDMPVTLCVHDAAGWLWGPRVGSSVIGRITLSWLGGKLRLRRRLPTVLEGWGVGSGTDPRSVSPAHGVAGENTLAPAGACRAAADVGLQRRRGAGTLFSKLCAEPGALLQCLGVA